MKTGTSGGPLRPSSESSPGLPESLMTSDLQPSPAVVALADLLNNHMQIMIHVCANEIIRTLISMVLNFLYLVLQTAAVSSGCLYMSSSRVFVIQ